MAPNILALQNALIEPANRMDSADFPATGLMVAASDAGAMTPSARSLPQSGRAKSRHVHTGKSRARSGRRSCGSMRCQARCDVCRSGRQGYYLAISTSISPLSTALFGDSTTNFNVPQKGPCFRFFEVVACICTRNLKKWRQQIPFRDPSLFKAPQTTGCAAWSSRALFSL